MLLAGEFGLFAARAFGLDNARAVAAAHPPGRATQAEFRFDVRVPSAAPVAPLSTPDTTKAQAERIKLLTWAFVF